ncbi:glycosyltransferase [Candidatus Poribacteria bacterium]|nr:glycosyltransferase [Candidatus Poribacteria bacterium]
MSASKNSDHCSVFKTKPNKHIWIVNHFATPPDSPGGTRHYDFAVELAKYGYDVTIFASDFNYMTRQRRPKHIDNKEKNFRFVWIWTTGYKSNNWLRLLNMLSYSIGFILHGLLHKRPDVIIGSSPHLFAALAACLMAKIRRCTFILEIRDLWPQVLVDMGAAKEGSLIIRLLRRIERYLYKNAEKIIILSRGMIDYLSRYNISEDNIIFLPNGVYLKEFKITEDRKSIRKSLELEGKFVVMYTGAHGPANGLDTILNAARLCIGEIKEVVFVLIGDGPVKHNLIKRVNDESLSNVCMLPSISKQQLPNLLNAADALIITLRDIPLFSYGVSPNKLFDYMASEKPVICAIRGETAKLVESAKAGIVIEPVNPEAIIAAVSKLKADNKLCRYYGKNGRMFVEENYSRTDIVKKLIDILNKCLDPDIPKHV